MTTAATENTNTTQQPVDSQTSPRRIVKLRPAVDLFETEQSFVMNIEMPGVDHSAVSVGLERNELTVTGTANFSGPEGSRSLSGLTGERTYERVFQLSDEIDREKIDAQMKQGVLTLTLPKSSAAQKVTLTVKGA